MRVTRAQLYGTSILLAIAGVAVPPGVAAADTAPPSGTPATVAADALPTWQINGVVWSATVVGTTVYAVGGFTKARPPGTSAGGAGEVARGNILAFDITTGNLITSFNHSLNGPAYRVVAAPDKSRIYVGGDFTSVDGQSRGRLAAFDVASGSLVSSFQPSLNSLVRGLAVSSGGTVYAGGNFWTVNGVSRLRLAAFRASDGALLPWAPTADDNYATSLVLSPDQTRVIIGGRFTTVNHVSHVGIASVSASTGALMPWSSRPIPSPSGSDFSYVTDLVTDGSRIYGSADGEGGQWFDGRFAADPNTGDLVWLDNCYGATYGLAVVGQVLFSASHAHDCSSLAAFPETNPRTYHRALAETTYATGTDPAPPGANSNYSHQPVPTLLHWFPTLNTGAYTGMYQGPWTVAATADYVVLGGEFTAVNGRSQQGLTRFPAARLAPNRVGPIASSAMTPTASSTTAIAIKVTWHGTWDQDNARLTYALFRDGTSAAIDTVTASSEFWAIPTFTYNDTAVLAGTTHTYRVRATDPFGNLVWSGTSSPVSAAA